MSNIQIAFLLAAIFLMGFFVWLARHNLIAAGACLLVAAAELCIGIIAWRKTKKQGIAEEGFRHGREEIGEDQCHAGAGAEEGSV